MAMIFENTPIDISQLPKAEAVEFRQPAPAYLRVNYISNTLFFAFLLLPLSTWLLFGPPSIFKYLVFAFYLAWLLLSMWLVEKNYRWQGHALREKDILFRKGFIFRKTTAIPFNRVQHCEIRQGPIERMFGLRTLEIYTAGGQGSDLSITGLPEEEALQLKAFIIQNTGAEDEVA